MFKKWFKPRWQHAQAEIRKLAVSSLKLDKPEHRQVLESLALGDEDGSVRLAAAERIEDLDLLLKVYIAGHSESLCKTLASLLIKRVLEQGVQWQQYQPLLDQIKENTIFKDFVSAEYGEIFAAYALGKLSEDEPFFAEIAQDFAFRSVRQQAAERLTQTPLLKTVLETAKNKDKSVYRIVKQKLDALRQVERAEADQRAEVEHIMSELGRLTQLDPDPLLPHKLKQLSGRWEAVQIDLNPWKGKYEKLLNTLNAKAQAFQRDQTRQQEIAQSQAAAQDSFGQICQAIEEALDVISRETALKAIDLESLQQVLKAQESCWAAAETVAQASGDQRARYEKLRQDVQAYQVAIDLLRGADTKITESIEFIADVKPAQKDRIEKVIRYLRELLDQMQWPLIAKRPGILVHMEETLKRAEQLLSESQQAIATLEAKIKTQMKTLKKAIDDGLLKEGQAALQEMHALMRDLPIRISDGYQKELRALMQRLNELRDWQGFATIPKKQALLEKMRVLAEGHDLPPQDRADRVKALQQAWRDLGSVHSQEEKALWADFKAAGEKAFEPCKAFFDAQQQQREQNLANREVILTELETYLVEHDWPNAVWPMVLETLKAARAQWRAASPVVRRHHQRTQRRFDKVVDEIQVKVDAERDRNAQRKAKLVEQATELLDSDDLDTAIEAIKGLQSQWKQVGIMKKAVEQKLWTDFQKAADALFGQRQRRWEDQEQQRAENKQRVEALTQLFTNLANQDCDGLLSQQPQAEAWVSEFEQIAPLPKAEAKALRRQFKAAHSHYDNALLRAKAAEAALAFEQLNQANQYLDQFERAFSAGEADSTQLVQLKEAWQQLRHLPSGSEAGINTRFDAVVAAFNANDGPYSLAPADLAKTYQTMHETVLQLEIILGIDSPSEDQDQRMSLQVSRLSEKLGGKGEQSEDAQQTIHNLMIKWCATSKLGAWPQVERLDARFQHAVQGWLKNASSKAIEKLQPEEASAF
jgi:hypothetical protein